LVTVAIALATFVLEGIIMKVCYENWFCELKTDKIIEREIKKLERKYPLVE
jgi:hypothetical protein